MYKFILGLLVSSLWISPVFAEENGGGQPTPASSLIASQIPQEFLIQQVHQELTEQGDDVLVITFDKTLSGFKITDFSTVSPNRIVVDLHNVKIKNQKLSVVHPVFSNISIVNSNTRSRFSIVYHGINKREATVVAEGPSLKITLKKLPLEQVISNGVQEDGGIPEIQDLAFEKTKTGSGRLVVSLSTPKVGINVKRINKALVVTFAKTQVRNVLEQTLDVSDFGTIVKKIEAFRQGESVVIKITPDGTWTHTVFQNGNKLFLDIEGQSSKEVKGLNTTSEYTGEKINLNFQDANVKEVLNVIADFTGLNVIIGDSVSGKITLKLKNIPWDQALDIILKSKGLAIRRQNNVIQIGTREEIDKKDKDELLSRQEISDLEEMVTDNFELKYQKGEDVVALLNNGQQKILSKRGSAVVDKRTNMLFVQDTPRHIKLVKDLLLKIDIPVKQVMIEAHVVSATKTFARNLGLKMGLGQPGVVAGGGTPFLGDSRITFNNSAVNLPSSTGTSGGSLMVSLFNSAATKFISLELDAIEADGKGKVVSSPKVITADQSEATIEQGQDVPYQQVSSSGATNVAFKKATLGLKVTPQITPDNKINLKVSVKKDAVSGNAVNGVPIIDTSNVDTQVLVENGGTVVLGGVYTTTELDGESKVPGLGDIPYLGAMFRSSNKTSSKSELMIFITPKILVEGSVNLN